MNFAGPGMEAYSLTEAVSRYYMETPLGEITSAKLANILNMFVFDMREIISTSNIRWFVFSKPFATAMILNVFLVIAVLYFIYRYCFKKAKLCYKHRIVLLFTIFSFTVWPILTYGEVIIHHGSYFNLLLIYALIALGVKHTNKIVANAVFFANILLFIILYVLNQNGSISQSITWMSSSMLVLTLISAASYFVYTCIFDKEDKDGEPVPLS
jgi:hypothetical protein